MASVSAGTRIYDVPTLRELGALAGVDGAIDVLETAQTPGLAPGESVALSFELEDGYLYALAIVLQAAGPAGAALDAGVWTRGAGFAGASPTPDAYYQTDGSIVQLTSGLEPTAPPLLTPSASAADWSASLQISGPPGAQVLLVTFTDGSSTERVNVAVRVTGFAVAQVQP